MMKIAHRPHNTPKHGGLLLLLTLTLFAIASCGHHGGETPRPRAYLRFDFPDKCYQPYDTTSTHFTFEKACEAQVMLKRDKASEQYIDIWYPHYDAVVYLTYKPIGNVAALRAQIDTSYKFVSQHFDHSTGVEEKQYSDPSHKVYALTYQLNGQSVASTYQFWATDSSRHFLRGALFLNQTPNNDSLAPILDYLQQDVRHLIETLRWKDQ